MVLRILALIVGTILLLLGIIGLLLPIVPQIPFIVPGLVLLGYASPRVRKALEPILRRFEQHLRTHTARLWQRIRRR